MYSKADLPFEPFDNETTVYRSVSADTWDVCDEAGNIVRRIRPYDQITMDESGLTNTITHFQPDLGASVAQEEQLIKGCENIIEFYDTKYLEMVNDSSLDEDTKKHYLRRADYEKWLAICRYVRANAPLGW